MELKEITEICRVIFTSSVNSEISNAMFDILTRSARNGRLPFKVFAIDEVVYDNFNYDLGVIDLGEFKIYDSLKTGKVDGEIVMTRYLRFTKGEGEDMMEIGIEL